MDFSVLRRRMVEEQLLPRGIHDPKVLSVFGSLERHAFVPLELAASAYADHPLPIGEGQTISQPYIVALMTELLDLAGDEKILEIGTGSGYQTAILALLSKQVFTIERFDILASKARVVFDKMKFSNITLRTGDGTLGWPEEAPFDRILVTAAGPRIPLPLTEQLREGGKLIIPLGEAFGQALTVVEKINGAFQTTQVCGCVFVPLVGKYGYKQD